MSAYVLVHGSWHGGWCWEKIVPLLERAGHLVRTPDLPGHGDDETPIAEVTSEGYVGAVGTILRSLGEPAVLVDHSMGGMVISQVAERLPDNVRGLAYVAGFLLRDGQSVLDAAQTDGESLLMPSLEWAADGLSAVVPPVAARTVFYGSCADTDAAAATARLCAEPAVPVMTPIRVTDARFGRIHRVYVECSEDRAVSPSLQRAMYAATPCARVASLATDHSPFYSKPDELAAILLSLSP
ncbi:MAG TPA: alpha/beta fold hydrolase [Candidatus Binatia bacterium]|nr:alpha/beta fold hydrolase [Candidatus Binatia bacterium]